MRITFISDTHTKHKKMTEDLPGGDLLIHAGDSTSRGYMEEIKSFVNWYEELTGYDHKIFIAGNHDWGFQDNPKQCKVFLDNRPGLTYLEDSFAYLAEFGVKIYGSPWQPEFYNWAFNLPRMGCELEQKWIDIPTDTDILITHGPPMGKLDVSGYGNVHCGCELLYQRIGEIKPKIHVFGHIHGSYGYTFDGHTHYINASMLDERYDYTHKPLTVDWDPETNEIEFL
jgi:predicted phosphohydrolase